MRLAVTGGRYYKKGWVVARELSKFDVYRPTLVYGCAPGADTIASDVADELGWSKDPFPAKWKDHGRAAGPIRNQEMVDSKIDVLVAFPGGRGTADMVRRAKAAGVPVVEVVD